METPNVPAGSTPAQAGPAQPASFPVPDGHVLVTQADHDKFKRYSEQVRGAETFGRTAAQYGFRKPEDFTGYGKFSKALQARGLTLEQLTAAFAEPEGQNQDDGDKTQPQNIDLAALKKEMKAEWERELRARDARSEHQRASDAAEQRLRKAWQELAGEGAQYDPENEDDLMAALRYRVEKGRKPYGEGHALREWDLSPPDEALIASVVDAARKKREADKGQALSDKAGAITKAVRTSPAGAQTGPSKNTPKGEHRQDGMPDKADVQRYAETLRAKRTGAPMSSLGR